MVTRAATAGEEVIVFDDLPQLPPEQVRALVEAVGDLPDPVTVVLCSRWPPVAPGTRWRGRGIWKELGPADLALSPEQVADLISQEYGLTRPDLAEQVHEATGSWPALVHLCAEVLRVDGVPAGPLVPAVARPQGLLAAYLNDEVFPAVPPAGLDLLAEVAGAGRRPGGPAGRPGAAGRAGSAGANPAIRAGAPPDRPGRALNVRRCL